MHLKKQTTAQSGIVTPQAKASASAFHPVPLQETYPNQTIPHYPTRKDLPVEPSIIGDYPTLAIVALLAIVIVELLLVTTYYLGFPRSTRDEFRMFTWIGLVAIATALWIILWCAGLDAGFWNNGALATFLLGLLLALLRSVVFTPIFHRLISITTHRIYGYVVPVFEVILAGVTFYLTYS